MRTVLQTVAGKRAAIADVDRKIQTRNADRAQVLQEQANIRENIKVLPAGSARRSRRSATLTSA